MFFNTIETRQRAFKSRLRSLETPNLGTLVLKMKEKDHKRVPLNFQRPNKWKI